MRIVVAMSGGVDSSVAAALLASEGHDVIGVSMQLYDQQEGKVRFGTCCTIDDLHDARRAAASIGIRHYIMNFERQFEAHVIRNFVQEYVSGRTPIPCSHCNSDLKFATLLDRAQSFEAEQLATGHYARVAFDAGRDRYVLKRGRDRAKDQSYFLFSLTQAQLARARFPVGDLDKAAVRAIARDRGLQVANKPDSHEICFVPDGDHVAFIERHTNGRATRDGALRDGTLVDTAGQVVGHHQGIHRFTVGQRKGLRLSSPVPLYVVNIDADTSTVTVGPRAELEKTTALVGQVNWIAGDAPTGALRVTAQIRHQHREAPATLTALPDHRARVVFDTPQPAIAPGQAAVFYDGDEVVGGGWIEGSE
jgi:tRNA-uridine 2-sulfurtransferase